MTKEEIKKEIIEDCSYDSNYDYYILTEQDINILVDELHKKLNMRVVGSMLFCECDKPWKDMGTEQFCVKCNKDIKQ